MKPFKLTLATAAVWELVRFLLLFSLLARLSGAASASFPLLLMPFAAPGLVVCAGFALLLVSKPEAPMVYGLLRLAKLLEVVANATALTLSFLLGRLFNLAQTGLLGATLVLDLIFLLLLISYSGPHGSNSSNAAASLSDVDDGSRL